MNELHLIRVLEHNYPGYKDAEHFWVGREINSITREESEPKLWAWEIDEIPEPTESEIETMVANYVLPTELAAADARSERDGRLAELDQYVSNPLRFNALSSANQAELAAYRQALLDVPQQDGFPDSITWPDKPSVMQ